MSSSERAAGLDIHKIQITATVRIVRAGKDADVWTRQFSAFPTGIGELVEWLKEHRVSVAVMEGTGINWEVPFEAIEEAGITPILVHAQHVKQIKGRKLPTVSGWPASAASACAARAWCLRPPATA